MNDSERRKHDEAQVDCEVEITDLGLPDDASNSASWLLASRFLAWQRSLSRGRGQLAMSLTMLFLIALVLLFNVHLNIQLPVSTHNNAIVQYAQQLAPINIKPSVVMLPQKDGFACVTDAAWSPDSKYVAFLGYQGDCVYSRQRHEPGLITIHDAVSGGLLRQLRPDDAILRAFSGEHNTPVIYYNSILWSPDGKNLAFTFSLGFPWLSLPGGSGYSGVMLIPNGSGNVQVLLHPQKDNSLPIEWDLQRHEAINHPSIPSLQPFVSAGSAISPTFAYRWGTNGTLLPVVLHSHFMIIPRSRLGWSQLGQVGDPDGGRSFTIWQPGMSMLAAQARYGVVPAVYTWNTNFVVWSPDGRYLVDSFFLQGRLQLLFQAAPDEQALADLHMDRLPVLTVRDMALQHLLMTLNPASLNMMVSWYPDGFVLAAYNDQTVDLDLFDCVSGYEIASLHLPSPFANPILNGNAVLRWSPDGSRLLLFDPQLGMVIVWKVFILS